MRGMVSRQTRISCLPGAEQKNRFLVEPFIEIQFSLYVIHNVLRWQNDFLLRKTQIQFANLARKRKFN